MVFSKSYQFHWQLVNRDHYLGTMIFSNKRYRSVSWIFHWNISYEMVIFYFKKNIFQRKILKHIFWGSHDKPLESVNQRANEKASQWDSLSRTEKAQTVKSLNESAVSAGQRQVESCITTGVHQSLLDRVTICQDFDQAQKFLTSNGFTVRLGYIDLHGMDPSKGDRIVKNANGIQRISHIKNIVLFLDIYRQLIAILFIKNVVVLFGSISTIDYPEQGICLSLWGWCDFSLDSWQNYLHCIIDHNIILFRARTTYYQLLILIKASI